MAQEKFFNKYYIKWKFNTKMYLTKVLQIINLYIYYILN